jgi:hypothetical protein
MSSRRRPRKGAVDSRPGKRRQDCRRPFRRREALVVDLKFLRYFGTLEPLLYPKAEKTIAIDGLPSPRTRE